MEAPTGPPVGGHASPSRPLRARANKIRVVKYFASIFLQVLYVPFVKELYLPKALSAKCFFYLSGKDGIPNDQSASRFPKTDHLFFVVFFFGKRPQF